MGDSSKIASYVWRDSESIHAAKDRVSRRQPVAIRMPNWVDFSVDAEACDCDRREEGILHCHSAGVLNELARRNEMWDLERFADALRQGGADLELDEQRHELVIHPEKPS